MLHDVPMDPAPSTARTATRDQLEWLRAETAQWQLDGTVTAEQARAILDRYTASRRLTLTRLVLGIGACFVGVGLVWLVAENLEHLSPGLRLTLVAAVWLLLLLGSELMHAKGVSGVVVGAGRTIAAFATGAVFLQAAQSLNIAEIAPTTVGYWAAACLLHAYVTSARGPLLVGIAALVYFSVWQTGDGDLYSNDIALAFSLTGLALVAAAALPPRHFAPWWRGIGAALTLAGLFVAQFPQDGTGTGRSSWGGFTGGWWPWALLVGALALTAYALVRSSRLGRTETALALGALPASVLLVLWETGDTSPLRLDDLLHALIGLVLTLALAGGIAVVGTLRDSRLLPALATLSLVATATFLAFAVFSDLFNGAGLFLLLGVVLLTTGYGFDRARRRIAAEVDDTTPTTEAGA